LRQRGFGQIPVVACRILDEGSAVCLLASDGSAEGDGVIAATFLRTLVIELLRRAPHILHTDRHCRARLLGNGKHIQMPVLALRIIHLGPALHLMTTPAAFEDARLAATLRWALEPLCLWCLGVVLHTRGGGGALLGWELWFWMVPELTVCVIHHMAARGFMALDGALKGDCRLTAIRGTA